MYLGHRKFRFPVDFSICLIGKRVDLNSSLIYMPDFLYNNYGNAFLSLYTYDYKINGIAFKKNNGYGLINNGFRHEK